VVSRERADTVGRQEFVLVQQVGEDALELRPGQRREQPAPCVSFNRVCSVVSTIPMSTDFFLAIRVRLMLDIDMEESEARSAS
jgi:hypothetical protein